VTSGLSCARQDIAFAADRPIRADALPLRL
jgi:hypothetical protein